MTDNNNNENSTTKVDEKSLKQEKIRRGFRIAAILLALYYFITAGFSFWEESKREEQSQNSTYVNVLSSPEEFRNKFNASIDAQRSSLPIANANDTVEGFVAVLSPAVEICGVAKEGLKELSYVQVQTRYPGALPPESLVAFKAFISACENTQDETIINEILTNLDIVPENDANADDKAFKESIVESQTMHYETKFVKDSIDELTIIARNK